MRIIAVFVETEVNKPFGSGEEQQDSGKGLEFLVTSSVLSTAKRAIDFLSDAANYAQEPDAPVALLNLANEFSDEVENWNVALDTAFSHPLVARWKLLGTKLSEQGPFALLRLTTKEAAILKWQIDRMGDRIEVASDQTLMTLFSAPQPRHVVISEISDLSPNLTSSSKIESVWLRPPTLQIVKKAAKRPAANPYLKSYLQAPSYRHIPLSGE